MGGGDLNMKKSWHPLLMKNQERVWLKEKEALAEKKKLDQLRKEKEEERQLQELQRLQEEQTGKKRQDKLDWMYATPATGGGPSASELEEYLLGKKRVDQILTGDENEKIGASHKNFIAVQNANNARDTAAKIREDPLFAIKQQEQEALKQLMSNPLRLKAMKEKAGIKEEKKEKKEKHKHKHKHRHHDGSDSEERSRDKHRHRHRDRSDDPSSPRRHSDRRSRSPPPRRSDRYDEGPPRSRDRYDERTTDSSTLRSRGSSGDSYDAGSRQRYSRAADDQRQAYSRDYDPPHHDDRPREDRHRSRSPRRDYDRSRDASQRRPPPPSTSTNPADADRAARLAAMSQSASEMESTRNTRFALMEAAERAEREREDAVRLKTGRDGKSSYVREQEKMLYSGSMNLDERIRRGRAGLVRDGE